jgi:hypothetical protein
MEFCIFEGYKKAQQTKQQPLNCQKIIEATEQHKNLTAYFCIHNSPIVCDLYFYQPVFFKKS